MAGVSGGVGRTVVVNGAGLRVEQVGSGDQVVVFSPSLYTQRGAFAGLAAGLGERYRCVSYDHRGQGDSGFGVRQPAPGLMGVEGLYEDAVALLDVLGVDRCHWVGASLGAMVGMRLAARHPERVQSLVLIGPNPRAASRADAALAEVSGLLVRVSHRLGPVAGVVQRALAGWLMRPMFGSAFMSDPARAADREVWRERFAAQQVPAALPMLREVYRYPETGAALLSGIRAPTLVLVGDDRYAGAELAREVQRGIADCRLVVVPGAGHVVLVEQPEAALAVVRDFIGGPGQQVARWPAGPGAVAGGG